VVHDDEAESASNAYLLSLVLLMAGAPLPILNLLASVIFFLSARRSAPFVRWHCTQALLGQLCLIPINSTFMWMTIRLVLGYREVDNFYIGWGIVMVTLNAAELIGSIYAAIKVRQGKDVRWWSLAPLTDAVLGRQSWGKAFVGPLLGALVIAAAIAGLARVPWIDALHVEKAQGKLEAKLDDLVKSALEVDDDQIRDTQLQKTLQSIVSRICDANDLKCDGRKFHLINTREINAAALPAGHVVINAGLVLASPNAEALAGVLAHEIAHSERGHLQRRILQEIGLSVLLGAGSDQSSAIFRQMIGLSYSRSMESEADRTAVDWLIEADINPTAFADFLATMSDGGDTLLVAMARSHPGSEERAVEILDRVPKDRKDWKPVLADQEWEQFRQNVSKAVTTPKE
jgi:beta-barrel assembly-enhancing protease